MSEETKNREKVELKKQLCLAGTMSSRDSITNELCPDCRSPLIAKMRGGVKCSSSKCNYWFCY